MPSGGPPVASICTSPLGGSSIIGGCARAGIGHRVPREIDEPADGRYHCRLLHVQNAVGVFQHRGRIRFLNPDRQNGFGERGSSPPPRDASARPRRRWRREVILAQLEDVVPISAHLRFHAGRLYTACRMVPSVSGRALPKAVCRVSATRFSCSYALRCSSSFAMMCSIHAAIMAKTSASTSPIRIEASSRRVTSVDTAVSAASARAGVARIARRPIGETRQSAPCSGVA